MKALFLSPFFAIAFIFVIKNESTSIYPIPLPFVCDRVQDSLTLLEFKESVGITFWNTRAPLSSWEGVILNEEGCVKSLILRNKPLNGSLPNTIFNNLKYLEILDLSNPNSIQYGYEGEVYKNPLFGTLPTSFNPLSQLKVIKLRGNSLSGSIPNTINVLAQLQELDLSFNNFSGTIPPNISKIPSLKSLHLGNNKLVGAVPSTIGELQNLEDLDIGGNAFNSLPAEIGNCMNLKYLSINSTLLRVFPKEIGKLQQLEWLDISENLASALPYEMGNLMHLRYLNISSSHFVQNSFSIIKNLTNLEELIATSSNLTSLPATISNLHQLRVLDLSYNNLNQSSLPDMGQLTNLDKLNLTYNEFTTIPATLGQLKNLDTLYLDNNKLNNVAPEMIDMEELKVLTLSSNAFTEFPFFITKLPRLETLRLDVNPLIKLPAFIGQLIQIKDLSIRSAKLTSIPPEIQNLIALKNLDISCNNLTSLPSDIKHLTQLEVLSLACNNNLKSLPSGIGSLFNLKSLSLDNTLIEELPDFIKYLKNLQYLHLSGTRIKAFPPAITELSSLIELNLSSTGMQGAIPNTINKLQNIRILNLYNNKLTQLPTIDIDSLKLEINFNRLTFEDILPNIKHIVSLYSQENIQQDTAFIAFPCQNAIIDLRIDSSITSSFYTWFKNGKEIARRRENKLDLQSLYPNPSDYAGTYTCQVTNPGVQGLVLRTGNIKIEPFSLTGYCNPYFVRIDSTLCYDDFIKVGDIIYNRDNPRGCQTVDVNGCKTLFLIHLDFYEPDTTYISRKICAGEKLYLGGNSFHCGNLAGVARVPDITTGCDSILVVQLQCEICNTSAQIPTAFTPNADGYNDTFDIPNIMNDPANYSNNHLQIFNRFRQLVFEQANYKNQWDGRDLQGNPLPAGTYFYTFQTTGAQPMNGTVTIIR